MTFYPSGSTYVLKASGVQTGAMVDTLGDAFQIPQPYNRCVALLDVTATVTDATDYLDVYLDWSLDGVTYFNGVHFTQVAGNATAIKHFAVLDPANPGTATFNVTSDCTSGVTKPSLCGPFIRPRWTITEAGTVNAAFTFSITFYTQ